MTRSATSGISSDIEQLFAEIEAYLAVIDAMRREGVEPCWASESGSQSRTRTVSLGADRRFQKDLERLFMDRPR